MTIEISPSIFIENDFSVSYTDTTAEYIETTDGDFCGAYNIGLIDQDGNQLDPDIFNYDPATYELVI